MKKITSLLQKEMSNQNHSKGVGNTVREMLKKSEGEQADHNSLLAFFWADNRIA